jgi:hypothetical protein
MWDRMATDKEVGLYLRNDINANRSFKKREATKYITLLRIAAQHFRKILDQKEVLQ